jgi:membrane protein DedA with SNARE-associated domain
MTDLSQFVLTSLLAYGEWALGAATLISALGLPMPATMLLLAAGASMQQGALNWQAAILLAALGAIAGDSVSYLLGRYGGAAALRRAQSMAIWPRAQQLFRRWGGLTIFLSRFLLTPLALPVNLIAGSTRYTPWRFLGSVALGESLWVLIFSGLGYVFADRWETLSGLMGELSAVVTGTAVLLIGGGYLLRRAWLGRQKSGFSLKAQLA